VPSTENAKPSNVADSKEIPENNQANSPEYRSPCGDTDKHSQADLCEQKRMSAAADRAADYAFWQLVIGGIGLVAVVCSLIFAGIAAFAARDAANAGTDAARVMRNAERPYLTPFVPELRNFAEAVRQKDWGQVLKVHLDFWNIGRGVGFLDSYGIAHEICAEGKQGREPLIVRDTIGRMPVPVDQKLDTDLPYHVFQSAMKTGRACLPFTKISTFMGLFDTPIYSG
jgi:hypothetical protein